MIKRNFTLLELILVVLILGLISSSALLVVENQDGQERYDASKQRLEQIHTAIVGLENSNILKGFIADTGQFPNSIEDLTGDEDGNKHSTTDIPDYGDTSEYGAIQGTGFSWGWRGPYITHFNRDFRDGWGNEFNFPAHDEEGDKKESVTISSLGADGTEGGSDFDQDLRPITIQKSLFEVPSDVSIEATFDFVEFDNEGKKSTTTLASGFKEQLRLIIIYPNAISDVDDDNEFTIELVSDNYELTLSGKFLELLNSEEITVTNNSTTHRQTINFENLNMLNGRAVFVLLKPDDSIEDKYRIVSTDHFQHQINLTHGITTSLDITIELDTGKLSND